MIKKTVAIMLTALMLLSIVACKEKVACDPLPLPDDSATDTTGSTTNPTGDIGDVVVSDLIVDGQHCSLLQRPTCDATVEEIFGIGDGWVNVIGTYQNNRGMFFVNEKGEVLNDRVYSFAYPFSEGRAYVCDENNQWFCMDPDGNVISEGKPNNGSTNLDREQVTVDGETRWQVVYNHEPISEPIFSWISSVDFAWNTFAILAEGEHRNVLINDEGKVTVTLPDDCTDAVQQEECIIATVSDADGKNYYRLLDDDGTPLGEHRFEAVSERLYWLAVGVLDGRLTLLDESAEPIVKTDFYLGKSVGQTSICFDGNLIAAVSEDNQLILLRLVFAEEPLRRTALRLVERAKIIDLRLYHNAGEWEYDYENRVEGVDWLYPGTKVEYEGQTLELREDYVRFVDTVFGQHIYSLKSLRHAIESVLTEEVARKDYYTVSDGYVRFVEYNGYLFALAGDSGYLPVFDRGSVKLVSETKDTVVFSIEEFYNVKGDGDVGYYTMKMTDQGWRLDTTFPGRDKP